MICPQLLIITHNKTLPPHDQCKNDNVPTIKTCPQKLIICPQKLIICPHKLIMSPQKLIMSSQSQWVYLRHISGISRAYLRGHILGISRAYLGHISGISWAYLGHRILILPPEVPNFGFKDGHFWQKWFFSDHKKRHLWWQNQNYKTIFIVQTFPKYCRKGFYFMKLSLLSPILAKFQFC